jgi:hypothetical protein
VGLVHDDKIPVDLLQTRQNFGSLGKIERRDNLVLFQPLVDAELVANASSL